MHNTREWVVLSGGISTLLLAMGLSRFGFTPIIPLMQQELHLSDWHIGVLASVNYIGYFLGAYAAQQSWLQARLRVWLGGSLVVTLLLLALMAVGQNVWWWSLLRLTAGFLSAILFVIASGVVLGVKTRAWGSYLYSGVGLGIACTGVAVPWLAQLGGWQAAWIGLAAMGALAAWHAWQGIASQLTQPVSSAVQPTTASMVRDYTWYGLVVSYGLEGVGYIITATYSVQMIAALPELGHLAHQSWVWLGLAAAPSTWLWGRLGQSIGLKNSLVAAYALQAIGILLPVGTPAVWAVFLGGILFGGTFMGITSLTMALAYRLKPAMTLQGVGELTAWFGLGQIIGPLAAVWLQAAFSITAPSVFAVAVLVLALLLLTTLTSDRKRGREPCWEPSR